MREKCRSIKKYALSTGLLLISGLIQVLAQVTLTSAGGNAKGTGGSASYSFGQVFYSVHSQPEGSITEGVQQPYEISVISGMDAAEEISLDYSAYPNPVTSLLVLRIEDTDTHHLLYQLFDSNGRLQKSENITCDEYIIPMEQYDTGIYYLNVISGDRIVKTFKIIKTR